MSGRIGGEADRPPAEVHRLVDEAIGLRAFLVLDDLRLGPAAGGVRTMAYPSDEAALADASRLARAMTWKCALGGLAAGGGKAVLRLLPETDREAAFLALGEAVEGLGGRFRTAGDVGTRREDLLRMASRTRFVHTEEEALAEAVGRSVRAALRACQAIRGVETLAGQRAAVQGCGSVGAAVARALAREGVRLRLADLDRGRALALAAALAAGLAEDLGGSAPDVEVVDPGAIFEGELDLLVPCALGGAIDEGLAARTSAWAVCGGANNLYASLEAEKILRSRGVLAVPDVISSAGAVIDGIGRTVMGLKDRGPLIEGLSETCRAILAASEADGATPSAHALRLAESRLREGRPEGRS